MGTPAHSRIATMSAAIARGQSIEHACVVFRDRHCRGRFVQIGIDDQDLPGGPTGVLETPTRELPGCTLPRLTPVQHAALAALGFHKLHVSHAPHEPDPEPNLRRGVALSDPRALAELCEQVFAILSAPADFELTVQYLRAEFTTTG